MKFILYRCCTLLSLVCCLACCHSKQESTSSLTSVEFSQNVMTIDYRILVGDPLAAEDKGRVQSIVDAVFDKIDKIFNKWNPASEVSQLNALPAHTSFQLSSELFNFLEQIDTLVELSQGRFDPTVEPLYQLWKRKLESHSIPTEEEIAAIKPSIGWDKVQFKGGVFIKEDSRTQLDFGGVAKGWCVDLLVKNLQTSGFRNLYVEWGGEVKTSGTHPSGRPWRIFISNLGNQDPSQAIAQINLIDQALATSGDYYQNWTAQTADGEVRSYSHLLNPLTLTPQEIKIGSVASSSLLAGDCMTADALAKVPMLFDDFNQAQSWINELQEKHPEMHFWIVRH